MNRILIIHRGSLGDFLLLLPALSVIRQRFPDARLEGLGRTEIMGLLCPGALDSMSSVERATLVPFFESSSDLPQREVEFFLSFGAVLAYISDPERNFERNLERVDVKNLIVRPPFPPAGERIHISKYLLGGVAPLLHLPESLIDKEPASYPPFVRFSEQENRQAEDFLEPALSSGKRIVAMHAGSGSEKKCWPSGRFEALVRRLVGEKGSEIVLSLGPADERLVELTQKLGRELGCIIADNLPLRQLGAVLSKCSAYVGNDSGVTHLAAATGIPTLAIFGPTDPAIWSPLGPHVKIITSNTECSPCDRGTMWQCQRQVCLEEIGVQLVAKELQERSG